MINRHEQGAGSEPVHTTSVGDFLGPSRPHPQIEATVRYWMQWAVVFALLKLLPLLPKLDISYEFTLTLHEHQAREGAGYQAPSSAPEKTQEHVGLASHEVRTPN